MCGKRGSARGTEANSPARLTSAPASPRRGASAASRKCNVHPYELRTIKTGQVVLKSVVQGRYSIVRITGHQSVGWLSATFRGQFCCHSHETDGLRTDDQTGLPLPGQDPCQRGEQGTIGWSKPRLGDLATHDGDLVTQDEYLVVSLAPPHARCSIPGDEELFNSRVT